MQEPRGQVLGHLPGISSNISPAAGSSAPSPTILPSVKPPASGDDGSTRGTPLPLPPPTLPPLTRSRSETPGDAASDVGSKRSFVQSILNHPQGPADTSQPNSRLNSPISSHTSPRGLPSLISRPSSTDTTHGAESPLRGQFGRDPLQRQILSGSPRLHRASSTGRLPQSSGGIDGIQFHDGHRRYVVETGTPGVLLPNPSGQRAGFVYDSVPPTHAQPRRASAGLASIDGASPRPFFASQSHSAQASPGTPYATTAPPSMNQPYQMTSSSAMNHHMSTPQVSFESERHYGGAAHTGQSVIQMMAVETGQGIVQVPVDVQAASRVADEKRKRNAGASARFRQRRKEKEMQASSMISRLEQELQDARDDVEFYRRERDTLSNILLHIPGYERHFPREHSPRHRRQTAPRPTSSSENLATSSNSSGAAYSVTSDRSPPPLESDRTKRRRTSGYSLAQINSAPTTSGGPSAYQPAPYLPMVSPVPQSHSQSEYPGGAPRAIQHSSGPSHIPQRHQEPYRDEHYERSWAPERNNTDRRGA